MNTTGEPLNQTRTRKTIKTLHFVQDTRLKVPKWATEDQRKILNASIARSEGMSRLTAGLRVAEKRDKGLKEEAKINEQEMNQMLQMMRMVSGWLLDQLRWSGSGFGSGFGCDP